MTPAFGRPLIKNPKNNLKFLPVTVDKYLTEWLYPLIDKKLGGEKKCFLDYSEQLQS